MSFCHYKKKEDVCTNNLWKHIILYRLYEIVNIALFNNVEQNIPLQIILIRIYTFIFDYRIQRIKMKSFHLKNRVTHEKVILQANGLRDDYFFCF